ncbi:DUF655 domain-containing protein [Salarchaeum sp. III]|uniref:DUF655 domain-containing protein n=1 Tax=Salarchaeum sp. III TaxID=3107927 RepID=UPI002ED7DD52
MSDAASDETSEAVVLDVLHHGRSNGGAYSGSPLAYAVAVDDFTLYELSLREDADISIGDYVQVTPAFDAGIERGHTVGYEDLTDGARSELDYVIEELVEAHEKRFVDFFNDAQPLSLRLHQLNLLPGIGDKLRDNVLDERKRHGPFESFDDLEDRVSGLHSPKETVVERIEEELENPDDVKYRLFVRRE